MDGMTARVAKKKPMNQWAICGIVILCVAALVGVGVLIGFGIRDKKKVEEDVASKVEMLSRGEIAWTRISGQTISGMLRPYLVKEDPDSLIGRIVADAKVETKVKYAGPNRYRVTLDIQAISAKDFIDKCVEKDITEYEDMVAFVEPYSGIYGKGRFSHISLKYEKKNGQWVCDYNDADFINAVTGGFGQLYGEYVRESYKNLQMIMEEAEKYEEVSE